MPLSVGDKLGPYEILAPIGAGGMGEVWKARDTRLDRIVAIERLKGQRTARFEHCHDTEKNNAAREQKNARRRQGPNRFQVLDHDGLNSHQLVLSHGAPTSYNSPR